MRTLRLYDWIGLGAVSMKIVSTQNSCIYWIFIFNFWRIWFKTTSTNKQKTWITVFRCLSPFKIGIHIYLEQSVWAESSWNPFRKRIASICLRPNHSGKKFRGKIWIFEKVSFNFSAEIGFFELTWRVTLL